MSQSLTIYLVKVEDQIQLAHIAKVLVQYFYEHLHQLEHDQLIVVFIHNRDEVQTGITLVNDLVLLVVQKIAHLRITRDH